METAKVTIYVDKKPYKVSPNQSMLQACLSVGFDLPFFCWHPAMGSVGACRQCAVKAFKDEKDERGKLQMACMIPASDGTRISISDPEAVAFRAGIIEGLMLNHPHDCPVCDEGGECHLQDMTVMTGHDYRRTRFPKRTFENQYLGPLVNQEMNRCIQCYRCVRFYRDYAGGHDFNSFKLRNIVFFGRHEEGVLESEFSGNLVEVCPTGVFTDKTLKRHYTRKWDLTMAPTICVHCGLGCNTTAGERYGTLRRILNRYNSEINGYFICDRGRFGYEFVNSNDRIRQPLQRKDGKLQPVSKQEAFARFGELLSGNGKTIGIGSPRASLEANFALRTLVGADRFYAGMSDDELKLVSTMLEILRKGPAKTPTLREIEESDAVLILGEDVTNIAPRMALSLRQAVRQKPLQQAVKLKIQLFLDHAVRKLLQEAKGPFFIISPHGTRLDDIATQACRLAPDDVARLGFAIAHALDSSAPSVPDLPDELRALAGQIAQALKNAQKPLVVSGPSCSSEAVIQASSNVARALCQAGKPAGLSFIVPESNSVGLGLMGGGSLSQAFKAVESGTADTVIVLENDLYRRAPANVVNSFLDSARHVVALDSLANPTTQKAELVLPAGTFVEAEGTLISSEGRAQRSFKVFPPQGDIQASWRWLRDGMTLVKRTEASSWQNLDHVTEMLANQMPAFKLIPNAAPDASFRLAGAKVPREPHRFSGRTSMLANIKVSEPKPPEDADSALSFTMEGYHGQAPASLTAFFWSGGWNSIGANMKYMEEVNGPQRGGNAGIRLIEPAESSTLPYFAPAPAAFQRRANEWLLIPIHHIFGSEELSRLSPAVAELSAKPYIALNQADAAQLQIEAGQELAVNFDGSEFRLPVKIIPSLAKGVAGLPAGVAPLAGVSFPVWSKLSRI